MPRQAKAKTPLHLDTVKSIYVSIAPTKDEMQLIAINHGCLNSFNALFFNLEMINNTSHVFDSKFKAEYTKVLDDAIALIYESAKHNDSFKVVCTIIYNVLIAYISQF